MAKQKWILITYAEKLPDGDCPNYKQTLGEKLPESLKKAQKLFPYNRFDIKVRNISPISVDFVIVRKKDNVQIGEIEKAPEGWNGPPMSELF